MGSEKKFLLILIVITFFLRGATVFVDLHRFDPDPDQYKSLAENLRYNGVLGYGKTPTAFRPPLYPIALREVFRLTPSADRSLSEGGLRGGTVPPFSLLISQNASIALFHWILGILTVLVVYRLAILLTFPPRWAFCVGLLTAIDPILLRQSQLVMTETLATFLAALSLYFLGITMGCQGKRRQRLAFIVSGMIVGASILCRPVFWLFAMLAVMMLIHYESRKKLTFASSFMFLLGVALVTLPWGARNAKVFGKFILSTNHGGYTEFLANNEYLYNDNLTRSPFAGPWDPKEFHSYWKEVLAKELEEKKIDPDSTEAEMFQDQLAKSLARKAMNENPDDFFLATLLRVGYLWQFLPYQTNAAEGEWERGARWGIGVFYLLEIFLAVLGGCFICSPLVSRKRSRQIISPYWSQWTWIFLLILSIQIPHLYYWTNMRMRAPLMVVIPILAVVGFRMILNIGRKNPPLFAIGGKEPR